MRNYIFKSHGIPVLGSILILFLPVFTLVVYPQSDYSDMPMGISLGNQGKSEKGNVDICPEGAVTIDNFLKAWEAGNFDGMYGLIDNKSKEGYSLEQAKFDFRIIEFKKYTISSVAEKDANFEFILSYGSWKEGNKDLQKIIIDGKSKKIIMPTRNSFFKPSADNYF